MDYTKEELERFCAILRALRNGLQPMRSGKHMKSTVYNMDGADIKVLIKWLDFHEETERVLNHEPSALEQHG